ncbi:thioesterase family protein [Fontimonas sp. SYSU GA230001]|uniref:acyl-CoA thioesterase n=1 Tax=Fontimonas sp. SYSU GA230001 TaxID=3142450 RepID=UPI0032B4DA93
MGGQEPVVPVATDVAAYRFWIDEHVRFDDLDMLGHVNNKSFTTYAESGRAAFLRHTGLWRPGAAPVNVIARLEVDYLRELHYPADVRVGVRVLRIGRSSFTLGLGMFSDGHCVATAATVLVHIDPVTRRSVELDADARARLEEWIAPSA